jgi:peptidoglycan/LPS O-acetylase OafA/YrhL
MLFALAIDIVAQLRFGQSPLSLYRTAGIGFFQKLLLALSNLTIFGLDWLLYLRVDHGSLVFSTHALAYEPQVYRFGLVPPAWSLSIELMFYLIAPFVARRSIVPLLGLMAVSIGCRLAGSRYGFDHDPWSYRFFPFELCWFLLGTICYQAYRRWRGVLERYPARILVGLVPSAIGVYSFFLGDVAPEDEFSFARLALLLAIAMGLPALHALTSRSSIDRSVGELSYPVYLGHFSLVLATRKLPFVSSHPLVGLIIVLASTIGMAMLVVRYVDVPLDRLRQLFAERARKRVLGGAANAEAVAAQP